MYQDIMNHEITKSIKSDAESNEKKIVHSALNAKVKKHNAGQRKNHKKDIVALKNICVLRLVVIRMKIPH
jgi:hypothetical protein